MNLSIFLSVVVSVSLFGHVTHVSSEDIAEELFDRTLEDLEDLESYLENRESSEGEFIYESRRSAQGKSGLSGADATEITSLHNKLRNQEGASNMQHMRYNQKVASLAQQWADRCDFSHGNPPFTGANGGFDKLGQNLFFTTSPFTVADGINSWYSEKKDFTYASRTCKPGAMCGHYTQIVWGETTDVGCGMAYCPSLKQNGGPMAQNAYLFVCNYGPQGNMYDMSGVINFPYLKGSSCSQCKSGTFFCHDGLCDDTCSSSGSSCQCSASCKNGAKTNSNSCSCTCSAGWTGVDCSEPCRNNNAKCGNGWPASKCNGPEEVWLRQMEQCPLLCGKCAGRQRKRFFLQDFFDNDK